MPGIGEVHLVFLFLLLFIVVFGLAAKKLQTPYPIVMTVGGLLLGLIPGIPRATLNPDLVFLVVLPPLLYSAAWNTSWRDFRHQFISIFLLAFGLVAFTVAGVALAAPAIFSGFDWRLGMVLGAVVAPTDAIAATTIARRVRLPKRVVDLLEGESLINDASGLLALQFATGIVVSGRVPTPAQGIFTLVWLTAGGIGLGLLAGWLVSCFERAIDDGPIEITLSVLTPYAVYLTAQRIHASGVLATVACGIYLSRHSSTMFSAPVRLRAEYVWESLTYVLNGLVFVLIGLQLPAIRDAIRDYSLHSLVLDGAVFSAILILLRLAWVFPGAWLSWLVRKLLLHHQESAPRGNATFVVGWAGMRGLVSLAAALALPIAIPHRNLIVFLAFCVICVTLVLQGLTLPSLIRVLGLAGTAAPDTEERDGRRLAIQSAIAWIERCRKKAGAETSAACEELARYFRERLAVLEPAAANQGDIADRQLFLTLLREAVRVERGTAIRLRDDGRISDEVLRHIESELDLTESRLMIRPATPA